MGRAWLPFRVELDTLDRRGLLTMIGAATSSSVLYQAMSSLGYAAESDYDGPISLPGSHGVLTPMAMGIRMQAPSRC